MTNTDTSPTAIIPTGSLAAKILLQLRTTGSMTVAEYMQTCLFHPLLGYYMQDKATIGREGAFITAPEISQMFGEMIALWVLNQWWQLGSPSPVQLVEIGGGRGTLMSDMLRTLRKHGDWVTASSIHMIEISPALKVQQQSALEGYAQTFTLEWNDSLADVPKGLKFILGNEVLDCFPIHQFIKIDDSVDGAWAERYVAMASVPPESDNALDFGFGCPSRLLAANIPPHLRDASAGTLVETSPSRGAFMERLFTELSGDAGIFLWIDYGERQNDHNSGDTLQALYDHKKVSPLYHAGASDLTAHVDFTTLEAAVSESGGINHGLMTQGEFLNALGIRERANSLKAHVPPDQQAALEAAVRRLTGENAMGGLFKVFLCSHGLDKMGANTTGLVKLPKI